MFLFNWVILMFHVDFLGCNIFQILFKRFSGYHYLREYNTFQYDVFVILLAKLKYPFARRKGTGPCLRKVRYKHPLKTSPKKYPPKCLDSESFV